MHCNTAHTFQKQGRVEEAGEIKEEKKKKRKEEKRAKNVGKVIEEQKRQVTQKENRGKRKGILSDSPNFSYLAIIPKAFPQSRRSASAASDPACPRPKTEPLIKSVATWPSSSSVLSRVSVAQLDGIGTVPCEAWAASYSRPRRKLQVLALFGTHLAAVCGHARSGRRSAGWSVVGVFQTRQLQLKAKIRTQTILIALHSAP